MHLFEPATDLDFLLFRQAGVLSRRQALRHMSDKAIRHRLSSGRWRLAHRAVYLTHSGPMTEEQRRWVASLAAGAGRPTYLAGISALAVLGLRGYRQRRIHVLVPAHRRDSDPPADVAVHRTRVLPRADRQPVASPPCTMPARSLLDAAQWARSDDEAVTIVAAGFQQRLVGIVDVEPVLARMPRLRRRRVIAAAVADAGGGAESGAEIEVARLCRRAGVARTVPPSEPPRRGGPTALPRRLLRRVGRARRGGRRPAHGRAGVVRGHAPTQ
jgi:hypothetical protein